MTQYIIRRLLQMIPITLGILTLIFSLIHLIPGDPAAAIAGEGARPEDIAQVRKNYGLDRPLPVQFADWVGHAATGDLGESYFYKGSVAGLIVSPGLIDLHTHVYWGGTSLGIDADEFARASGVTTAIDTGSAGPGNFMGFRRHVIEPSAVRILAHICFCEL